ncbi:hypothetical protein AB5J72_36510 [Streptomyces sp. CG1]|uniref:hypothetical protein n=1 Tax=Streptomyces sp. CG1 TaxID=1287523 RepID=UPI0034E19ED1
MKRHVDLKNEFYECVRTEAKQVTECEKRMRETIAELKKTIVNQNAELEELRQLVTNLALARAVLVDQAAMNDRPAPVDNVVPFPRAPREGL